MSNQDKAAKSKTLKFKAEVKQLLDIVINSLYTDKHIFVRELISNAADALEKIRHLSLTDKRVFDKDLPLEINIELDEIANTFIIRDTGIGMTKDEASTDLGTIAHSGSREFLKQIEEGKQIDATLIGQFGVGFYSAFMVADEITVHSKSYKEDEPGVVWSSSGSGTYKVSTVDGLHRGTAITVKLKKDAKEFANIEKIKELIKQYSNFVPFPINIKGEQVNTIQAIWTRSKNEIEDHEYNDFYNFFHFAGDQPFYKLHFKADAPLAISALLFFPGHNTEYMGFGRMEPGVNLYCKKILIQQKVDELLPEYFRFIRGVVDSEDLPLNISRETMQDSALIAKLKRVLTKRLIKHLQDEAKEDSKRYKDFFKQFGNFIKEGVYSDFDNKNELGKLLLFDSSAMKDDELTSLDGYIERMPEEQTEIYYKSGTSREAVSAGPYLEKFRQKGIEVLMFYEAIDDLVMTSLREYEGKKLVSADSLDIKLLDEGKDEEKKEEAIPEKDAGDLARWMKEIIGDKIDDVRVSKRLVSSPAVIVNPDDSMTTTMKRFIQATSSTDAGLNTMILEVNPSHPILQKLNILRGNKEQKDFAEEVTWMLYDNALINAGLLVEPKTLVERGTKILERALEQLK